MMDGVLLLVLLLPTVAAALANAALLDTRRAKQLESTVRQAASSILIVDGENVRGKSLFQLSHPQLMARLARWSARHKLADRVVLLVDHGTQPSAFHLPRLGGLSVVFSGPTLSADDVAARDLEWLHGRGHDVLLVTADSGLAQRCRLQALKDLEDEERYQEGLLWAESGELPEHWLQRQAVAPLRLPPRHPGSK